MSGENSEYDMSLVALDVSMQSDEEFPFKDEWEKGEWHRKFVRDANGILIAKGRMMRRQIVPGKESYNYWRESSPVSLTSRGKLFLVTLVLEPKDGDLSQYDDRLVRLTGTLPEEDLSVDLYRVTAKQLLPWHGTARAMDYRLARNLLDGIDAGLPMNDDMVPDHSFDWLFRKK